jgi:hypothetical protein
MASTSPNLKQSDIERKSRESLNALIGEQLLHRLGRPIGLLTVQVRKLWDDRYRANVYIGTDAASATVIHSYFLVADGEGNITAATPAIVRAY